MSIKDMGSTFKKQINLQDMPSREADKNRRGATTSQSREPRASRHNAPSTPSRKQPQQDEGEEAWDDIMNMKSGGSDGSFDKMNTSFFLREGEEIDIVVLDESPCMFWGHTIKCQSQAGKTFYRIEQCQKSEQDSCVMCDSQNKAIGAAKKIIGFRVLDSRGSWDRQTKAMDGVPAPKIFMVPLYLAKQLKSLKDDAGTISDKVIKLSKTGNYQANFKYRKNANGSLEYVSAPDYEEDLPDILEVYKPMGDSDLIDFIRQFAEPAANTSTVSSRTTGGGGSFGK